AVLFDPIGRLFFRRATDLADQNYCLSMSIFVEQLDRIEVRQAADWIAADADASRLPEASHCQLPDGFVGQRPGTRDHADTARFMNVAGHDPDLACARRNDPRTIRA